MVGGLAVLRDELDPRHSLPHMLFYCVLAVKYSKQEVDVNVFNPVCL